MTMLDPSHPHYVKDRLNEMEQMTEFHRALGNAASKLLISLRESPSDQNLESWLDEHKDSLVMPLAKALTESGFRTENVRSL